MPDIFISPSPAASGSPSSQSFLMGKKPPKTTPFRQALSAYLFMPEGMRFETQEEGETIILLLRKHWITNAGWILISLILLATPFFLFPTIVLTVNLSQPLLRNLVPLLIFSWYLLTFSYMLVNFLLWYFTVSMVTSERIVDVDFVNILNKKFAATRIARVEDVTMRTGGFLRAFFDYGNVFVQTAATDAVFQFDAVPKPEQVVRIINRLMGKEEDEGGGSH